MWYDSQPCFSMVNQYFTLEMLVFCAKGKFLKMFLLQIDIIRVTKTIFNSIFFQRTRAYSF